ncbi:uncharacterized protein K452DRAFT_267156 [Aplosporella prunicola CBS 121167]|uniref:trans-L-3-hydroxyproline dehydratase n=1 Tax=Aplosporella prunicola CBS 121167 TaxID=1176127 RepID=A0A6A6BK72_9PEZI|nr:uncharacterized protein K452DRAFT_267156 [Aplosporella prunicola CBS 121167]KAF2144048.1 hypothetical protein K452DRAFT_267156 [Aplosporella prunicola CBS 121167]
MASTPSFIAQHGAHRIRTIDMHTTGEPTRIIYAGYPELQGATLLAQRAYAAAQHDALRRALLLEPRGHRDMYGALLRPRTEHTISDNAHMGVLFLTNAGYSTMCGHATLALGRMLVDCDDAAIFPQRGALVVDEARREVEVRLHAPCGVVRVTVPVVLRDAGADAEGTGTPKWRADPTRPVCYLSVPSFATGLDAAVSVSPALRWAELAASSGSPDAAAAATVTADVAYGGAFYLLVRASALGFPSDALATVARTRDGLARLEAAATALTAAFNRDEGLRARYLRHPDSGADRGGEAAALEFLYGVIITDDSEAGGAGKGGEGEVGEETGLCVFAARQIDRSPTGSGVQARVAAAVARGTRQLGQRWRYQSVVSVGAGGEGAFVGRAVEEADEVVVQGRKAVRVEVEGRAWYMGAAEWVLEDGDVVGRGFEV